MNHSNYINKPSISQLQSQPGLEVETAAKPEAESSSGWTHINLRLPHRAWPEAVPALRAQMKEFGVKCWGVSIEQCWFSADCPIQLVEQIEQTVRDIFDAHRKPTLAEARRKAAMAKRASRGSRQRPSAQAA